MTNSKSFYSLWGFRIVCLAVFLLPIVLIGSWQAMRSNTNDVREWLPKEYPETKDYAWFKQHFGNEDFVVATWEGCHIDDDRLTLLADKLKPAKEIDKYGNEISLVRRVVTGKSLMDELTGSPLNLTPEEVTQRFRGTLFGPDGEQTCAAFTLTDAAKRDLKTTITAIRRIATQECGITTEELKLGGPPVVNQTIDVASASSLRQLATLSGIVGLLIAWWCFRTIKLTVLVVFAGVYSAMCSMAVVAFSGQVMNAILMTMAPLVYVAATSGAIHLANYYREAVLEKGSLGAAGRAIRHAWLPLSLATSTTAVGLLSLWYSELLPIKLFGLFSAIGVVISLFSLFLLLPSVLELWPVRPQEAPTIHDEQETGEAPLPLFWQKFAGMVTQHYGKVSLVCFGVLALCILGLPRIETSIKIMRFFSPNTPIIHTYRWMEEHLGALVPMEVIIRVEKDCPLNFLQRLELVQHAQERIEQLEHVGSSISVVNFAAELPKRSDWPADPGWSIRRRNLNRALNERKQRLEDTGYLASGDGEQLYRISVRVGALNDIDYGEFIHRIEHIVKPVLAEQLAQKVVSAETGETMQVQGIAATYTGMVPVMYKAQRSLLNGMLFGFGTDLALVVVAIMVLMRHWSSGALLCLTSIFPATVVFGIMGWQNIIVDIGTVMTPSVALGVTIDDVVHFLLWFRRGIERGLDRRNAVLLAYQGCARAMYQSWGVIGLGLSMFALSSFTPTMRFGSLMVALLTAGLVGNLFFLPALLTGPLGGVIASSIRRRMARTQERAAAVSSRVPEPQPAEVFARGRRSVKT